MDANAAAPTIDRADSALLIVDLQVRLVSAIATGAEVVKRAVLLAGAARLLGVPTLVTEQNPAGLGHSVPELAPYVLDVVAKRYFSAARSPGFFARLPAGRKTVLIAGAEAHVCVLQTALGLANAGYRVGIVSDAIGSRRPSDKESALRRLQAHGVEVVTTEMVVFEWLDTCDVPDFKAAMVLIKPI